MKSNELRIGNFVYETDNLVVETCNWHYEAASLNNTPNEIDVKPIPLNEEWSLKFGFDEFNRDGNRFILIGNFKLEKSSEFDVFYLEGHGIDLQYVHQLQNLYHALTQKELQIKELVT